MKDRCADRNRALIDISRRGYAAGNLPEGRRRANRYKRKNRNRKPGEATHSAVGHARRHSGNTWNETVLTMSNVR
jgi:hypothetical protein